MLKHFKVDAALDQIAGHAGDEWASAMQYARAAQKSGENIVVTCEWIGDKIVITENK